MLLFTDMFTVIYEFRLKPGEKENFIRAWTELTLLIRKHEGSLGSRLHRSSEEVFIAYAQWPDRSAWENSGDMLPPQASDVRSAMRDSCESIKTLYELEVIADLII